MTTLSFLDVGIERALASGPTTAQKETTLSRPSEFGGMRATQGRKSLASGWRNAKAETLFCNAQNLAQSIIDNKPARERCLFAHK